MGKTHKALEKIILTEICQFRMKGTDLKLWSTQNCSRANTSVQKGKMNPKAKQNAPRAEHRTRGKEVKAESVKARCRSARRIKAMGDCSKPLPLVAQVLLACKFAFRWWFLFTFHSLHIPSYYKYFKIHFRETYTLLFVGKYLFYLLEVRNYTETEQEKQT